ncbi:hypothetical protein [Haloglomus salinum]|uniref:hypothetical protein n=1 Tax=Haloglomus salinum TaxID=2962673 RepID=UPI0020CA2071|nr:hypothetical protein [Haloglomus salinum]
MSEGLVARASPVLVAQTLAFLAVVIGLPVAFSLGGRLRYLALAAVGTLLLVGFILLGLQQAHRSGTLVQHATFLVVWLVGAAVADGLAKRAAEWLPEPLPFLLGVGIGLGALWFGARLAYDDGSVRGLLARSETDADRD